MGLEEAKRQFTALLGQLQPNEQAQLVQWVQDMEVEDERVTVMRTIQAELRAALPVDGSPHDEDMWRHMPSEGDWEGYAPHNTLHLDAFLYEDDDLDALEDEGNLKRYRCNQCGSQDVMRLHEISHSFSLDELTFLFRRCLPDLSGKTVLDVGSRLGAVLYAAYLFSTATRIVGVEITKGFCDLQTNMLRQHSMQDRCEVICADIAAQGSELANAHVVVMHNVFEFFCSPQQLDEYWGFVRRTLTRKGQLLVTSPSLEACGMRQSIDGWAVERPIPESEHSIFLYEIQ